MNKQIRVEQEGAVCWVRLYNPPQNLFTLEMTLEIDLLIRNAQKDDKTRVMVFTGGVEGRFVEHFDASQILAAAERFDSLGLGPPPAGVALALARILSWTVAIFPGFGDRLCRRLASGPLAGLVLMVRFLRLLSLMEGSAILFVAAISGNCGGGAFEFACSCDFRYAARRNDILFGHPECLAAMIPSGGGCQRLSRIIGPARAISFILDGRPMNVEEALALGVLDEAFAPEEFLRAVADHARRLSRRAPQANRAIKRLVYRGTRLPFHQALALEQKAVIRTGATKDSMAGLRTYLGGMISDPEKEKERIKQLYQGELIEFQGK